MTFIKTQPPTIINVLRCAIIFQLEDVGCCAYITRKPLVVLNLFEKKLSNSIYFKKRYPSDWQKSLHCTTSATQGWLSIKKRSIIIKCGFAENFCNTSCCSRGCTGSFETSVIITLMLGEVVELEGCPLEYFGFLKSRICIKIWKLYANLRFHNLFPLRCLYVVLMLGLSWILLCKYYLCFFI